MKIPCTRSDKKSGEINRETTPYRDALFLRENQTQPFSESDKDQGEGYLVREIHHLSDGSGCGSQETVCQNSMSVENGCHAPRSDRNGGQVFLMGIFRLRGMILQKKNAIPIEKHLFEIEEKTILQS